MSLTLAQIQAAQQNDIAGLAAVLAEMEPRVGFLAAEAARRVSENMASRADFEQDAREALFRALPLAEGTDADRITGFLYTCMRDALKDRVREVRYAGADMKAVKIFMSVMGEAEGNGYRAEQLAQTLPAKTVRLGADRAFAARLAWQGTSSLDAPTKADGYGDYGFSTGSGGSGIGSVGATLTAPEPETDVIRPKVGHGAALEALKVLERYADVTVQRMTPGEFAANLPALVETLEDTLTVPREANARRYVLDAMAILRSAVSTAADGDLAEELRDASDDARDARAIRIGKVREVLDEMLRRMPAQAEALMCSFGILGRPDFGFGDKTDVPALMAHLGCAESAVWFRRSNGRGRFAELFIARVARSEDEAESLRAAAAECRKNKGRK